MNHGPTPIVPSRRDLHRIFREVEAETGIVLRGDFSCCSSCGQVALDNPEVAPRGYAFYHAQDTDHALTDGVVYLCFHGSPEGSPSEGARTHAKVGRDLVHALAARGLFVQWNRRVTTRIMVAVDRRTFDRYAPESHHMAGLATPVTTSALDDGWSCRVWEEPEATHPEARWCGMLIAPDDSGASHHTGSTREEVEAGMREVYPSVRAEWGHDPLVEDFVGTPVGDA
ncbi:MAG: hypothetical protein EB084_09365 [Proteobacteria bacterium]|nr:hypothetical protein [Pseudomonadota bacterium]